MPNLAVALKEEIRRLARKEIKAFAGKTRQAVSQSRGEIAQLRRAVQLQQKELTRLQARNDGTQASAQAEGPLAGIRYSVRSLKAQRRRLKLSAADYGRLIGVSALTVYHWESGRSRPRRAQIARLVAIRGIGKREARARLAACQAQTTPSANGEGLRPKKPR